MIKKSDLYKSVYRPYPPLFSSIILSGYKNPNNFKYVLDKKFAILSQLKVDHVWHYSKREIEIGSNLAFNDWRRQKKLAWLKREFKKREISFLKSSKKDFLSFTKAYEFYMPALALIWITEFPLVPELKKLLAKKLPAENVERLMNDLNIPIKNNFYKQEQLDLIHARDLKKHAAKWSWINSRYGEYKPYTSSHAKNVLSKIDKQKILEESKSNYYRARRAVALAKKNLPKKATSIIDLMQYIIYYRTQRTDIINMSQFLAYDMLKKMAKNFNLTYQQLLHCTKEEIIKQKIPAMRIIFQRMKKHAMLLDGQIIRCETGTNYYKLKQHVSIKHVNLTELQGNIACSGIARGKVKLIYSTKDFAKIKQGDILITSMTNPHMLPIMKKAAAFVTDEGGITCHAAIISREMKKPCLIGTKIATKIFKDGDIVEVDAVKGVVKKYKNSADRFSQPTESGLREYKAKPRGLRPGLWQRLP